MSETLRRQWCILRAIPRAPHSIDVSALMTQLSAAGLTANKRTVQRDLNELSRIFPLNSDGGNAPHGWCWRADAPAIDVPMMESATALSVGIIEQWLLRLGPLGLGGTMASEFLRSRSVLDASWTDPASPWLDRVRVLASDAPLRAPKPNDDVVRVVFAALVSGKQLRMTYAERKPAAVSDRQCEVNPLGLIVRGRIVSLVCMFVGAVDIREIALHRVGTAIATDTSAVRPVQFDLDRYIESGGNQNTRPPTIELQVRFRRKAAADLYETVLSEDQIIEEVDAEHVIVKASVRNTPGLASWLLGFGEFAEVLKPESLRQSIERSQRIAAQQYIRRST